MPSRILVAVVVAVILGLTGVFAWRAVQATREPSGPSGVSTPAVTITPGQPDLGAFSCLDIGSFGQGSFDASGTPAQQVRNIAREVEGIRDLHYEHPVHPHFLSPEASAARVARDFRHDYTRSEAADDERVLEALGAIPDGYDLRAAVGNALGSDVAGFYDPQTEELVVRSGGQGLHGFELVAMAHELEHALADQVLEIPVDENPPLKEGDANLASLALVEGDATLTMERFAARLSPEDALSQFLNPDLQQAGGIAGLPHVISAQLLFPYTDGREFACHLYQQGGWKAIDRAYDRPPGSTAEVLFPERYGNDHPSDPRDPSSPGARWHGSELRSMGAGDLLWLFEAPGDDIGRALSDPRGRAAAWRGGEARDWTRGSDLAFGMTLDERPGADSLCGSIVDWYRAAFPDADEADTRAGEELASDGSDQDAVVWCDEDEVRLGIGPNLTIARSIVR